MSDDGHIDVPIGGNASSETARTRAAFVERAQALNELKEARADNAAVRVRAAESQAQAEQAAAVRALEEGNWNDHAARQRKISELAVERARAEDEARYWQSQQTLPSDPVDAFIASRANEPETQAWLRAHPADALVLATGSDPRRQAKLNAADCDAFAAGHARGSKEYFEHVEKYLGGKATSGESEPPKRIVRVVKSSETPHGPDEMSRGEHTAATETITWGYEGGAKRGQPIGVEEYLRRRNAMRKQPGWFQKLD
jgi:hypothetical protein